MSQGITWFDALAPKDQSEALLFLRHHCVQARAVAEDGPEGGRRAGLRPTHTPAVLITRGRINDQLGKIASLTPRDERRKAFRLLVAVLAIADRRRRERYCSNGCSHWLHTGCPRLIDPSVGISAQLGPVSGAYVARRTGSSVEVTTAAALPVHVRVTCIPPSVRTSVTRATRSYCSPSGARTRDRCSRAVAAFLQTRVAGAV